MERYANFMVDFRDLAVYAVKNGCSRIVEGRGVFVVTTQSSLLIYFNKCSQFFPFVCLTTVFVDSFIGLKILLTCQ